MNLVLDTGYYLLISSLVGRSSSVSLAVTEAALRLKLNLHMSALVWMECASHTCYALPAAPFQVWQHSAELVFLRRFPATVHIDQPEASVLIDAAINLRRVVDPNIEPRRRKGPSIVDAVTAELVRRTGAEVLVSADHSDFELLLPGFDGEIWTPRELVDQLYV